MPNFEPIGDRILCKDKTRDIDNPLVPESMREKIHEAEVVIAPMDYGYLCPEGAIIRFNPFGVEPIKFDDGDYMLIRIADIYGVVR